MHGNYAQKWCAAGEKLPQYIAGDCLNHFFKGLTIDTGTMHKNPECFRFSQKSIFTVDDSYL